MTEIWVVQPYIPAYRVAFFESLRSSLEASGVDLRVVAGRPDRSQAERGDAVTPPWLIQVDGRRVSALGRSLTLTTTRKHWQAADAVIVPHMGSSFDALSALTRKSQLRVGVWGHIASYTATPNPIDSLIERWQLRRADHIFAYTPSGASFAIAAGADAGKITTVMNAIDTTQLKNDLDQLDSAALEQFRRDTMLPEGPFVAYLGALDTSKRVDLLAAALDVLWGEHPHIHFIVGGQGQDASLLEPAVRRGQATMMGHVGGKTKAAILKCSKVIANPGRVGLLAVDALVAGVPVVSTKWPFHAPEIEYLAEGESLYLAEPQPESFAATIVDVVNSENRTGGVSATYPTLQAMVRNFAGGIHKLLN